ncbi:hypothetical protein HH1059_13850 [Halorhodospira halochloris]|uniref:DUF4328 domain-containing protein n=1 Tax=Halorhodospira halochloris TaxID=1052 RepID=A0A2Z6EZM0_HALHR|nr:hypothetical protein [Halorhodospira halochloris]BBE11068.1 hypothetical protein HH1059_13850 [Halorhodospira halochloris]
MGAVATATVVVAALIIIAAWVWFNYHLQQAFEQISANSRHFSPGLVWLNLIPFFNIAWTAVLVVMLDRGYRKEYPSQAHEVLGHIICQDLTGHIPAYEITRGAPRTTA